MAGNHQKEANEAREHSDSARRHSDTARRSSDEHLEQLGRMQKSAREAEQDTADRSAHRKRRKQLKRTAVKQA